ncbi:hypothetical protein SAMN05421630_110234 [Prauserella marina]|uniref:Uncharacterized protein n=1 Tax=Prauserella marina TaxID=530584 RepID=A0A1G6WA71_9PSEU|nr:hypothetical protein DES30_108233 [Prauserella marina]SDD61955.1 hypothetical protein SAMN05421630_110234 [Prauserella marina]
MLPLSIFILHLCGATGWVFSVPHDGIELSVHVRATGRRFIRLNAGC